MAKKIALVTGANKGLGLETAKQLAEAGHVVLLGARDLAKARIAAEGLSKRGLDVRPVELDVTNPKHIERIAASLATEYGQLDVLVNNAGVNLDPTGDGPDILRRTYETNVIGPYALAQALRALLERSEAGRIVNQSSVIGSMTVVSTNDQAAAWAGPGYASSKAALNMLTVVLARRLAGTRVKVNSAHPGWVKTDLGGAEAPMNVVDGAKTAVTLATLPADGPTGGFFHLGERLPW